VKYKAVVFDLDGTLLNTLQDLADSVNAGLRKLGFPEHELRAYNQFVGEGRDVLAERALPEDKRDYVTIDRLVELINSEYLKRWADNTKPYDGIPGLLDELSSREIKMAILSNKAQNFTELTVNELLPDWHFEEVAGVRQGVPKKPDPYSALQIAKNLGLEVSEILFLGDSDIDMKTATAAGMYPVGAAWGFRSREELIDNGAKIVIDHPNDLLELL